MTRAFQLFPDQLSGAVPVEGTIRSLSPSQHGAVGLELEDVDGVGLKALDDRELMVWPKAVVGGAGLVLAWRR